jgi:uncharacterized protein (DUF302 family)
MRSQDNLKRKGIFMKYGLSKVVDLSYDDAVAKVTEELQKEGFGVLTTIDVKETLKKKIDVDFKRYVILGACNPQFAHKALMTEEEIGLLLPCNVIVHEKNGRTGVAVFDPMAMTELVDNPGIRDVAEEVKRRLQRVVDAL